MKHLFKVVKLAAIVTCVVFLINSCGKSKPKEYQTKSEAIKNIYRKVEKINLPIDFSKVINNKSPYITKGSDSLIFPEQTAIIGALVDTSNFYGFILRYSADTYFAGLSTFSKSGKFLSKQEFSTEGGEDCGSTAIRTANLLKDLSLKQYSRIGVQECGNDGPYGPTEITENVHDGRIDKHGNIIMKETVVKKWVVNE
ncbi:MAG: hypothetical protein EOO43_00515 [Flavobacterium sp.]|nr:MAG: hypothetical protein EOO43_00515 [Flavobacterium sp.]